jgi:ATP-binding cassette subfamily B protein
VLERVLMAESGTHQELLELKGLYYAMWRQQIGERKHAQYIPVPQANGNGNVMVEKPA